MNAQRGGVLVEYLAVLLALAGVWAILEVVTDDLAEHQQRYQWTISLPY